jgi:hypothetical protein
MYLHPINRREENLRLLDLLYENKWFSILGEKISWKYTFAGDFDRVE